MVSGFLLMRTGQGEERALTFCVWRSFSLPKSFPAHSLEDLVNIEASNESLMMEFKY